MATKKVETAAIKPKVQKASKTKEEFKGWAVSQRWMICPNCGKEVLIDTLRSLHRCPVCGAEAE